MRGDESVGRVNSVLRHFTDFRKYKYRESNGSLYSCHTVDSAGWTYNRSVW